MEGRKQMPADLEALYKERDAIGSKMLKQSADTIHGNIVKAGLSAKEADRVLDYYAINRNDTAVGAQYLASEHAVALAKEPLKGQITAAYIRLADERGVDVGTADVEAMDRGVFRNEKLKRDATAAVKAVHSYFFGDKSLPTLPGM